MRVTRLGELLPATPGADAADDEDVAGFLGVFPPAMPAPRASGDVPEMTEPQVHATAPPPPRLSLRDAAVSIRTVAAGIPDPLIRQRAHQLSVDFSALIARTVI